jgi:hypothetical protein
MIFSATRTGELGSEGVISWIVKLEGSVLTAWIVSYFQSPSMNTRQRAEKGKGDWTYIPFNDLCSGGSPSCRVGGGGDGDG